MFPLLAFSVYGKGMMTDDPCFSFRLGQIPHLSLPCCELDAMDIALSDTTSSTKIAVQNMNMTPTNEKYSCLSKAMELH